MEPDAISQPVPMTFIACLHAQLQNARKAAAEGATSAASSAASTLSLPSGAAPPPSGAGAAVAGGAAAAHSACPPRVMIAGGERSGKFVPRFLNHESSPQRSPSHFASGKSSIAKILANYAVRMDQKPVRHTSFQLLLPPISVTRAQIFVDLDCSGGVSNVPGSIGASTMARVIPPVSAAVSQPWHRTPLAFFVAHEQPDKNPDAVLNAVTCVDSSVWYSAFGLTTDRYMGIAIKNRLAALLVSLALRVPTHFLVLFGKLAIWCVNCVLFNLSGD